MKKTIILIACVLLITVGCSNSSSNASKIIIGEWLIFDKTYIEFFEDGTYEETCGNGTCNGKAEDHGKQCVIRGTYEVKNNKTVHKQPTSSTCESELNTSIDGFSDDFIKLCGNAAGICPGGYQQTSSTPYHLNDDGTRIK